MLKRLARLLAWIKRTDQIEIERYLSLSVDVADFEARMHKFAYGPLEFETGQGRPGTGTDECFAPPQAASGAPRQMLG